MQDGSLYILQLRKQLWPSNAQHAKLLPAMCTAEAGHSDAAGDDQGSSQAGSHSQAGAGPGHGLPAQPLCLALAFTDVW